jgi:hypothetical protein
MLCDFLQYCVIILLHFLCLLLKLQLIFNRGCISFWDGNIGTQIESFQTHKADILCLCLAEDENSVYCAGKLSVYLIFAETLIQDYLGIVS